MEIVERLFVERWRGREEWLRSSRCDVRAELVPVVSRLWGEPDGLDLVAQAKFGWHPAMAAVGQPTNHHAEYDRDLQLW